jgi:ketosteroid isomerase-like protein
MKITKFTLLFFAIVSIAIAAGCAQTGGSNVNTTTQAVATPEPTPDKDAIVAEITRMEKDWPRILKEKDGAAVRRMEADDVILLAYNGMLGSKEQDIKDIEAGNLTFESWEVSEVNVKVIDKDAAVASLLMTITGASFKIDESHSENISGHYRALDTFARRNGQWQVVASSIVKLNKEAEQALNAAAMPSPASASTPMTKSSPATRPATPRRSPPPPPANQ